MKKLLTIALLIIATAAFANDGNTDPIATEKNMASAQEAKKAAVKQLDDKEDKEKEKPKAKQQQAARRTGCSTCTGIDPRFDLGGYFVEFINRNNLKLVKLLTE